MKENANQKLKKWLDNMRDLTKDEEKACLKALENMSEEFSNQNIFRIVAKEDFIDQKRRIRLVQGEEYELIGENEDNLEVIDETGRGVMFSKRCFYYEED